MRINFPLILFSELTSQRLASVIDKIIRVTSRLKRFYTHRFTPVTAANCDRRQKDLVCTRAARAALTCDTRAHARSTFKLTHFSIPNASKADLYSLFYDHVSQAENVQMSQNIIDALVTYQWVNGDSFVFTNESIFTWLMKIMQKWVTWLTFFCECI